MVIFVVKYFYLKYFVKENILKSLLLEYSPIEKTTFNFLKAKKSQIYLFISNVLLSEIIFLYLK